MLILDGVLPRRLYCVGSLCKPPDLFPFRFPMADSEVKNCISKPDPPKALISPNLSPELQAKLKQSTMASWKNRAQVMTILTHPNPARAIRGADSSKMQKTLATLRQQWKLSNRQKREKIELNSVEGAEEEVSEEERYRERKNYAR